MTLIITKLISESFAVGIMKGSFSLEVVMLCHLSQMS